jgi:Fic family protein
VLEVENIRRLLDALKFAGPPVSADSIAVISKTMLVECNTAILGQSSSVRTHAVAVGHQKIVLPRPAEVPHLLDLYVEWVNGRLHSLRRQIIDTLSAKDVVLEALSLACDAHTTLVHIHPFPDGNGRLARIVSGLILRASLLPPPLFLKEDRRVYTNAVGRNTIHGDSTELCALHTTAVLRTLDTMLALSKNRCVV